MGSPALARPVADDRWRLRPTDAADLEWAFALHRETLGGHVAQAWGWDEDVQRRLFIAADLVHTGLDWLLDIPVGI